MATPIDAFATTADMAERSNGAIPADRLFLAEALKAATARIRNYCGWHIATEQSDTLVLDESRGRVLYLPTLKLSSIDSMTIDGTAVVFETDALQWDQGGRMWRPSWSPNYRGVQLTITHGYAEVPADLVDLTLELATGELQSAGGAIREQTLASSVTWARASGRLTEGDKDALAVYRIGYTP